MEEKMYLQISGVYICPNCNKIHDLDKNFMSIGTGMYDSGIYVNCDCGLDFSLNTEFSD